MQESSRRMGHVRPIVRVKTRVWTAPILNWSADDKLAYMKLHALRSNPVVEQLCMSGECLCGAFAQPGEIHEIAALYPKTAALIRALEVAAEIAGVPAKWGVRPPRKLREPAQYSLPLCWSCEAKRGA